MYKVILFSFYFIASISATSLSDYIKKTCPADDASCQCDLFESTLQYLSKFGDSNTGTPIIDPYYISDFTVNLLGFLVTVSLTDGYLYGLHTCDFSNCHTNVQTGIGGMVVTCKNLTIDGDYTVKSFSNVITGNGKVHIYLEDLTIPFLLKLCITQGDDNQKHLEYTKTYTTYKAKDFTIYADDVKLAGIDITKPTITTLNQFNQVVLQTAGRDFVEKAVDIYRYYSDELFSYYAADQFIRKDDLDKINTCDE